MVRIMNRGAYILFHYDQSGKRRGNYEEKIISTLLCTAMLATMVAGCGVEKSDGGSDTESSASSVAEMKGTGDNEINILIYAQDHEKAVYQELIDKFTKEHADEISTVNFEVTTQDEYATKMTAAMTAGELPDIFYVGPEAVRSYVDNGYVQPLDDLVDATAVDNLWPAIKSAYMYDGSNIGSGSLYCLPKDLSCFAFAYNKDLLMKQDWSIRIRKIHTHGKNLQMCARN